MKNKFNIIIFFLILIFVVASLLKISQFTVGNSVQKSDKTVSYDFLIPPNPDADLTAPQDTTDNSDDLEYGGDSESWAPLPDYDNETLQ